MSNLNIDFGEYLYSRLPQLYRDEDVIIKRNNIEFKTLQEYLFSFAEGGFEPLLEDIEAITNLIDPEQCPEKFLPLMLQHFGLDFVEDIGIIYQRRLLQNIVELYKRKGTIPCIAFLARELSGFKVEITETTEGGIEFALVKINAFEDEDAQLKNAQDVINRYIHLFLPTGRKHKLIVAYDFSEGIHFNETPPLVPHVTDHVYYKVVETFELDGRQVEEGIKIIEGGDFIGDKYNYFYETPTSFDKTILEYFDRLKTDYGIENADISLLDNSTLTNEEIENFTQTNGINWQDTITYKNDVPVETFFEVRENSCIDRFKASPIPAYKKISTMNIDLSLLKYSSLITRSMNESNIEIYFVNPDTGARKWIAVKLPKGLSGNANHKLTLRMTSDMDMLYITARTIEVDFSNLFWSKVSGYDSFSTSTTRDATGNNYIYSSFATTDFDKAYYASGSTGVTYVGAKNGIIYISNPSKFTTVEALQTYLKDLVKDSKNVLHVGAEGSGLYFRHFAVPIQSLSGIVESYIPIATEIMTTTFDNPLPHAVPTFDNLNTKPKFNIVGDSDCYFEFPTLKGTVSLNGKDSVCDYIEKVGNELFLVKRIDEYTILGEHIVNVSTVGAIGQMAQVTTTIAVPTYAKNIVNTEFIKCNVLPMYIGVTPPQYINLFADDFTETQGIYISSGKITGNNVQMFGGAFGGNRTAVAAYVDKCNSENRPIKMFFPLVEPERINITDTYYGRRILDFMTKKGTYYIEVTDKDTLLELSIKSLIYI